MIITDGTVCHGVKLVATVGTFDGVHAGHRCLLRQLVQLGSDEGLQTAVVTFGTHPRTITSGVAPGELTDYDTKIRLLDNLVDYVIVLEFDERLRRLTAAEFMAMLKERYGVEMLLIGFNNRFGCDRLMDIAQYERAAHEAGIRIHLAVADDSQVSSTAVRHAIESGCVDQAALMLGRRYAIWGKVVHGQGIGHTIGFPTANLVPTGVNVVLPGRGVYAVDVVLDNGERYRGVMNIGTRPTVSEAGAVSLEVHLLGYSGTLYSDTLTVEFIVKLRDERRFESIEELREQIKLDAASALGHRD